MTTGCGDACPVLPGRRYLDRDLADPAEASAEEVRDIRDDLAGRVQLDDGVLRLLGDPLRARRIELPSSEALCTSHLVEMTGAEQTNAATTSDRCATRARS